VKEENEMLIKLDEGFMVNTDSVAALAIENGVSACLYYGADNHHYWDYNSYEHAVEMAQKKFDEISALLEKAVNLRVGKNGAFLCSHCGAPNSDS